MNLNKEQIVYKKVSELYFNEKNPRKNDNAVDSVAKSIEKYGFRNPIIIDTDGKVWCGNTRLKASIKLGLEEVPCIVVEDLTEQEIRELALLDNKTNEIAEWDFDLLAEELEDLDLSEFELDWGVLNADELGTDFEISNNGESEIGQMTFTLHKEQQELIRYAISLVQDEVTETFGNTNKNGNALYEVVKQWAEQRK